MALIAVPTVPHRFAVEPATGDASRQLNMYLRRHPPRDATSEVEILSPGFDPEADLRRVGVTKGIFD